MKPKRKPLCERCNCNNCKERRKVMKQIMELTEDFRRMGVVINAPRFGGKK